MWRSMNGKIRSTNVRNFRLRSVRKTAGAGIYFGCHRNRIPEHYSGIGKREEECEEWWGESGL